MEALCELLEVAGSIRRQKPKVHDIDFVVVTKSDADWQKINEELIQLKAKPNCSGNSVIKAFVPCENGFFQVDFYRATPSTFGIHLLVRTGSAEHNMWLAGYALYLGRLFKTPNFRGKIGLVFQTLSHRVKRKYSQWVI